VPSTRREAISERLDDITGRLEKPAEMASDVSSS